jgi:hypothetical protein
MAAHAAFEALGGVHSPSSSYFIPAQKLGFLYDFENITIAFVP